ncbi:MAG: oligosaccharide flippase family protein [Promethearchaeota archaeon]
MSLVQIVVVSGVLLLLYRFLLSTIGVEKLGILSLVLATTSVAQIANFGLSGSVVKFVARHLARGEEEKVSGVIQTAAISVASFTGCLLLIGFPVAKWALGLVIRDKSLAVAIYILPCAFFAFWIMVISSIFLAALDGYQRIDLRNFLLMGGAFIHLLLCFLLTPTYGLIGVLYSRVIQNIIILFCSWFLLKKYLPSLPIFPYKWQRGLFKEIIGYGLNLQFISIAVMTRDPITKGLISRFGGLSMVGYYEIANQMSRQIRSLIGSANNVLVPAIADLKEKTPEKIKSVYLTSYQLVFYLGLTLCSVFVVSIPIISELVIGRYERIFVIFGILLIIASFEDILAGPAYFANLGIGELRWNVVGHITLALLNAIGGFLLGMFFGGIGVVSARVISLAVGSSIIYLTYHIRNSIPLIELVPKASKGIIGVCLIGILYTLFIQIRLNRVLNTLTLNSIIIMPILIIIFVSFWLHPMRKRLTGWITTELLNRRLGE